MEYGFFVALTQTCGASFIDLFLVFVISS